MFDGNFRRLKLHAMTFLGDEEEAEDIVADVFFVLWKKFDDIDVNAGITAYLYRAVTTRSLNRLRHQGVAGTRVDVLEDINHWRMEYVDSTDDPELVAENAELRAELQQNIDALPDKARQVFVLSYINGLKNKEIAQALGLSVRTVEAHIYKCLKILRGNLAHLLTAIIIFLLFGVSRM